ncbi:hypothetical protein [Streptomyces parvulus]|uniref:hypothetical protein n=1 Tax=Streptomyces parvulus TaxID=146923 RepID=UPI0033AB4971
MSDRIALDGLTSDQLDQLYAEREQLYAELDAAGNVLGSMARERNEQTDRAVRAEAALSRTRSMAEQWRERASDDPATAQAWTSAANAVLTSTSTELRTDRATTTGPHPCSGCRYVPCGSCPPLHAAYQRAFEQGAQASDEAARMIAAAEPAPVRESYRIRVLETRVSDAEYERDLARQRAKDADAALAQVRALRERARTEAPASQGPTWEGLDLALDGNLPPAPAATGATDLKTTARVLYGLHQVAEDTVTRVITLHEQWVAAGPPPLGAPLARWWDKRLAELHNAIQPPAREQRERPTHPDGTPYRHHEIKAEGWEHCDGCHLWGQGWTAGTPHQCTNDRVQPADTTTEK